MYSSKIFTNERCVGCNLCISKCPCNEANVAVMEGEHNKIYIDGRKCIVCGECIRSCTHNARDYSDDTEQFLLDLKSGKNICVIAAPSLKSNVRDWPRLLGYLKSCGVSAVYDTSFGADICTWAYLRYITANNVTGLVSQPCPAIVNYVEHYATSLIPRLAPIHSPAMCTAIYMKKYKNIPGDYAFLSPCIAKHDEFTDTNTGGLVKYNVTFKKLLDSLNESGIDYRKSPAARYDNEIHGMGAAYPMPGGLKANVERHVSNKWIYQIEGQPHACRFLDEYSKKNGSDATPFLVDILNCQYGCNIGTGAICTENDEYGVGKSMYDVKMEAEKNMRRKKSPRGADFDRFDKDLSLADFRREYTPKPVEKVHVSRAKLEKAYKELKKFSRQDRIKDCRSCGYSGCEEMATAVARKINHVENCVDYNRSILKERNIAVERKSEQLRMAREDIQSILDNMPIPVRITSKVTERILYANNACMKLFDYGRDMVGKHVYDLAPPYQSDGADTKLKTEMLLSSREPLSMEFEFATSKGEPIDALVTVCEIEYHGDRCMLCIITDLAAEKAQKQMLLSAAEKEKEANLLKSRFLVNMSHEIRTPMNAIIGLTQIELQKEQPEKTRDIYTKIHTSAMNLLRIINDILDLSKIEAGKIELYEDKFELEEVLNSALLVASPRLDGKRVEFMLDVALDLPRYLVGDSTRLWQILKNFLDNSAKYTEKGKIVLTVRADKEGSDDKTVSVTFIIEDTGIGIKKEHIDRLFVPYEQIYNNAQKKYTGTGLGMVISKQMCNLMGGRMQLQSRLGEGTTIRMTIPFARLPDNESEVLAAPYRPLAGMRMLAVDDDKLALDIMCGLLKNSGVICTPARSGAEAYDLVLKSRDRGEMFDLILLDYMMDDMNGLETAKHIHLALSDAPKLLLVTAYQKLLLKSDLDKNGVFDVIEKPFIPSLFIHKLCVALGFEADNGNDDTVAVTKYKDTNVLLCEDYKWNQEVAEGMFAHFGIKTTVAENGEQGIKLLESGKTFDLIFMDLQMPVMDGYEATKIIRADRRFDNIPIISLTADAMREVVDECLAIGMNDHVAKPIELEALQSIFHKWLPESKRDVVIAELPAYDSSDVLARFGGNRERYERAILEFAGFLPDSWPDFGEAVKDADKLKRLVHKIKGAAGNLYENEIYVSASELENSLYAGTPDEALYAAFIERCEEMKKRVSEPAAETEQKECGTDVELDGLLSELRAALDGYDPRESSRISSLLSQKKWPGINESILKQMCETVEKYEFDEALDLLNEIITNGE